MMYNALYKYYYACNSIYIYICIYLLIYLRHCINIITHVILYLYIYTYTCIYLLIYLLTYIDTVFFVLFIHLFICLVNMCGSQLVFGSVRCKSSVTGLYLESSAMQRSVFGFGLPIRPLQLLSWLPRFLRPMHTIMVMTYLWLVGNGRMVVIVVIIVPHSSIPY